MLRNIMTLLDAKQYDFAGARRRRNGLIVVGLLAILLAWFLYHERNHSERKAVRVFFGALESRNYEQAYSVWQRDPDWKQHPQKFPNYPYNDFYTDWGPGGQWGLVKSYQVACSLSTGSGVIVQAVVNERSERSNIWVDKSNKSLSFPPSEIQCGNWWAWLTE
jgi:hypothetical protein